MNSVCKNERSHCKNEHFYELKAAYRLGNAVYNIKATCRNIIVENYRGIRRNTLMGMGLKDCGMSPVTDSLNYKNTLFMCMLIDEDVEARR